MYEAVGWILNGVVVWAHEKTAVIMVNEWFVFLNGF
jgi:hypothetical protein